MFIEVNLDRLEKALDLDELLMENSSRILEAIEDCSTGRIVIIEGVDIITHLYLNYGKQYIFYFANNPFAISVVQLVFPSRILNKVMDILDKNKGLSVAEAWETLASQEFLDCHKLCETLFNKAELK